MSTRWIAGAALTATLAFGGCAQQPQQFAAAHGHGKEYFPSSVYGRASRRVIADGQPVPHGGGQYLVGKPYTVAGQTYYPSERRIVQIGNASWYGDAFHGRLTANGEIYDRDSFSAAHPTMPLPSYARVTNLRNHYSMIVRVNDRGPYASDRVMDVSRRVAEALDFKRYGTARVKVEYVGRASLAGSDDAKLYATLRTDGPARWGGDEPVTSIAQASPSPSRVASIAPFVPAPASLWSERRVEDRGGNPGSSRDGDHRAPRRQTEGERPDALAAFRAPRQTSPSGAKPVKFVARPEPSRVSRSERGGEDPRAWPRGAERQQIATLERPRRSAPPPVRPLNDTSPPFKMSAAEARRFALRELLPSPRVARHDSAPRSAAFNTQKGDAMPPERHRDPRHHQTGSGARSSRSRDA